MLKKLACAAALFLAAISNATAQPVTFAGGGQITASTNDCFSGPILIFPSIFVVAGIDAIQCGG